MDPSNENANRLAGPNFTYTLDRKKCIVTIRHQKGTGSEGHQASKGGDPASNKSNAVVDNQQVTKDSEKTPNKVVHENDAKQSSLSAKNNKASPDSESGGERKKQGRKKKESQGEAGKPPTFNCKICNKTFMSKSGAKGHEKHHQVDPKLFCLVCKKSFKFSYDLDRHMKTHTGHRPYQCADCEKSFVCKSSLMQHVRQKHIVGNIYMCSVCAKSFCTETDLKRHSAVHSEEKPFKCDKCTKTFTCKSSLKAHQRNHGEKKFACSFCNMHFHLQSDLSRHVTIHTGDRPWKCKLCEKGYSCKSTLKVHLKHVHKINPMPADMIVHLAENENSSEHLTENENSANMAEESDSDTDGDNNNMNINQNDKGDKKTNIDRFSKFRSDALKGHRIETEKSGTEDNDTDSETDFDSDDRVIHKNKSNNKYERKDAPIKYQDFFPNMYGKSNDNEDDEEYEDSDEDFYIEENEEEDMETNDSDDDSDDDDDDEFEDYLNRDTAGETKTQDIPTSRNKAVTSYSNSKYEPKNKPKPQSSNKTIKLEPEHIVDPYKVIDEMNKDMQLEESVKIHPMSRHKPSKGQRKAKFVRKLEICGDGMLVYKS